MCHLFPYIYDILRSNKDYTIETYSTIINDIKNIYFNDNFNIQQTKYFQNFQERSGIVKLAINIGKELKEQHVTQEDDIIV